MNTDAAAAGDARRALRAILAGDVVGYSRHMGEAEEATLAALARHRAVIDPLIVQHHGGIFTTAGDSVLAAFETPSQAVRCALAVQENLVALHREATVPRRLIFRIGVHAGDILVRGHAPIGDAINVAARLESAATPGRVLISREVLSHLEPELADRFRFRGNQTFKDQPLPLATYEGGGDPIPRGRKRGGVLSPWWGAFVATSGLAILGYLFAVYDGLAFFHAGIGYRLAPAGFVLTRVPPTGSLTPGQTVLIDDSSCPAGRIRQISGGNMTLGLPRGDHCIPRP